jgi:hypothetical protein
MRSRLRNKPPRYSVEPSPASLGVDDIAVPRSMQ